MWPFSRKPRRKAAPLAEQPVPNLFMRCPKHLGNYILWGDQGRVYRPVPGQGGCPCRGHPRDVLDDYIAMRLRLRKTKVDGSGPFCKGCGADLSKESHFGACTIEVDSAHPEASA